MSTLLRFLAIAVSVLLALPAFAAQRTFVASTGVDTNPCTLAAPCRSFTGALTQTDANGEVLVLDSAGYGAFTVTQSVSVIAADGVYAGISVFPGTPDASHGIVVNSPGIRVTLRGLTVNGQGGDDGIRIQDADDVFLEKVTVANTGNDPGDAGIRVTSGGTRVYVTDTTVRGGVGSGISIEGIGVTVLVDRSRIERNGARGIRGFSAGGTLAVTDSLVARNTDEGISVIASSAGTWEVTVARSTIAVNGGDGVRVGGGLGGTYRIAVTDSVVRANGNNGVLVIAGPAGEAATALSGDNRSVGNSNLGIACTGTGTATLVAERNEVVRNGTGLFQGESCIVKSMGNNTVENNGTDVTGVITPATLR